MGKTGFDHRRRVPVWLMVVFLSALAVALAAPAASGTAWAQTNDRSVEPQNPVAGNVPGDALGNLSDAELWRAVRKGVTGTVSIPDKQAGVLVQSEGDNWRAARNGPVTQGGLWLLGGMLAVIAVFFAVRGRIKVDAGLSGATVERFNNVERFAHWLSATSFIVLALSGLNMLYGKYVLLPVLGPEAFSLITLGGKYAHNFLAFAFMAGLVLMFVLWIRDNIPNKYDMFWLVEAGGFFTKGKHPPSRKFNAGQKIIFWVVILGGLSLSISGIALLFPFKLFVFSWTFQVLNAIGISLPTDLTALQEMQLSQIWHGVAALVMTAVILAHIYIGSLGMQGAFDAMGTGQVDENWAREHHNIWLAEVKGEPIPDPEDYYGGGSAQPAE